MKIISNTGGVFATNSYLVIDEDSGHAVIFDAPNDTTAPLLQVADQQGAQVVGLWLTHGHIDHIADHAVVTAHFPDAGVVIHALDEKKLQNPKSMYPLPFQTLGRNADAYLRPRARITYPIFV
jgi:glyoxylase-like metal-dependent hydrolase (beta-lactamase superfamily II)